MYKYIIITIASLMPLQVIATKHPTALELMNNFAATQEKLKSFIAKAEGSTKIEGTFSVKKYQTYFTTDARVDGKRAYVRSYSWGDINPTMYLTKDKAYYASHLWNGNDFYQYNRAKIKDEFSKGNVFLIKDAEDKQRPRHTSTFEGFSGSISMGHLPLEAERVDSIIRKADSVFVRDKMEKIGDSDCYVIEAKAKTGDYTVWIDPAHSYNIAKAEVRKGQGNVLTTKYVLPQSDSIFVFMQNVRFEKIGDLWIPMEANCGHRRNFPDGSYYTQTSHHKITEIELNPDHDKLGSFVPDDILNGATVRIIVSVHPLSSN